MASVIASAFPLAAKPLGPCMNRLARHFLTVYGSFGLGWSGGDKNREWLVGRRRRSVSAEVLGCPRQYPLTGAPDSGLWRQYRLCGNHGGGPNPHPPFRFRYQGGWREAV